MDVFYLLIYLLMSRRLIMICPVRLPLVRVSGLLALSGKTPPVATIVTRHFFARQREERAPHRGRISGIISC
jgi:hypothetical protein